MNASINHLVRDDGVWVNLTNKNGVTVATTLSFSAIKRFAWGVLADLDPEEARACGMPQEGTKPKGGETQAQRVVRTLYERGPLQHKAIAEATGIGGRGAVSARLASLIDAGAVARDGKDPATGRQLYKLTTAGVSAHERGLL